MQYEMPLSPMDAVMCDLNKGSMAFRVKSTQPLKMVATSPSLFCCSPKSISKIPLMPCPQTQTSSSMDLQGCHHTVATSLRSNLSTAPHAYKDPPHSDECCSASLILALPRNSFLGEETQLLLFLNDAAEKMRSPSPLRRRYSGAACSLLSC